MSLAGSTRSVLAFFDQNCRQLDRALEAALSFRMMVVADQHASECAIESVHRFANGAEDRVRIQHETQPMDARLISGGRVPGPRIRSGMGRWGVHGLAGVLMRQVVMGEALPLMTPAGC